MPDYREKKHEILVQRLNTIARHLYRIHPDYCGTEDEWKNMLLIVIDTLGGSEYEGREEVQAILNTFMMIRPQYTDLADIVSQYTAMKDKSASIHKKILKNYAYKWPALVLMSPSTMEQQKYFRFSFESSESDLAENQKVVRKILMELVVEHVDFSKTNWQWLTQLYSCVFRGGHCTTEVALERDINQHMDAEGEIAREQVRGET